MQPISGRMWWNGSSANVRDSGRKIGTRSQTDSRLTLKLPKVSMTPLGAPVVPEVKRMAARASAGPETSGASATEPDGRAGKSSASKQICRGAGPASDRSASATTGWVLAEQNTATGSVWRRM